MRKNFDRSQKREIGECVRSYLTRFVFVLRTLTLCGDVQYRRKPSVSTHFILERHILDSSQSVFLTSLEKQNPTMPSSSHYECHWKMQQHLIQRLIGFVARLILVVAVALVFVASTKHSAVTALAHQLRTKQFSPTLFMSCPSSTRADFSCTTYSRSKRCWNPPLFSQSKGAGFAESTQESTQSTQRNEPLSQSTSADPAVAPFPSYLLPMDKSRGYIRKMYRKQIVNFADVMASNGFRTVATKGEDMPRLSPPDAEPAPEEPEINSHRNLLLRVFWSPIMMRIISVDLLDDIRRRKAVYKLDWTDALQYKRKVIPAILFLYFSCLAPAVSFGTIASQITNGTMGIVEFLLSAGISGMAYAVLCGQPMGLIAPTGLTLAFIAGLFRFCTLRGLPFFPIYSWVGLWTSFFFVSLGLGGCSQLIRFCTRFTDEIFNALLSLNFIYEACSSLKRNFQLSDPSNLTMPFVSLGMALSTAYLTMKVATFDQSKYLNQKARTIVKDFGPVTVFVMMSILNQRSWIRSLGVPTLAVSSTFQLAGSRPWLVDINGVPNTVKFLCAAPALLLTALFYMDHNISIRVVNNPDNKMKKGPAYNLDMIALGLITGGLSLLGLPWMCGATVQSLNHVRAMTDVAYNVKTGEKEVMSVCETRTVPFLVHALMLGTLGLLPVLSFVPTPVVAGVFLFLGRRLMTGNSFLQRVRDTFVEKNRLPKDHPIRYIGRKKTFAFTGVQILCLIGLWCFKQNTATSIFFPGVIGLLILIRAKVLPLFFTEDELTDLGDPTPA
jgi:hypothetical protein